MLRLEGIQAHYGKSHVLQGVSLEVEEGETVALLGRNGVGKTTALKAIMGLVEVRAGRIFFDGRDLGHRPTHEIARTGIGYIPENREVFPQLTVAENLQIGPEVLGWDPLRQAEALAEAFRQFPRLRERRHQKGGTLSGGEQQMVAIARAFAIRPRLLLMDEPTEGLMPSLVEEIEHSIVRMNREHGIAILLVEQNAELALRVSRRAYVMEKGVIRHAAASEALRADLDTLHRYLGIA